MSQPWSKFDFDFFRPHIFPLQAPCCVLACAGWCPCGAAVFSCCCCFCLVRRALSMKGSLDGNFT